jgi:hypothetical protein
VERLTTVALIERKIDISRLLFTRYWRDVHGVMAARIPGFESYTQYHVTGLTDVGCLAAEPFEGVALVTFADAAHRAGLAISDISQFIQRDEQNVFRRALLYNLEAGASESRLAAAASNVDGPPWLADGVTRSAGDALSAFLLIPAADGIEPGAIAAALGTDGLDELHVHDLTSGDPTAWNKTDVDDGGAGRRFISVMHGRWRSSDAAAAAITRAVAAGRGAIAAYRVDHAFVMVEQGTPTALGLRGWDALQTIREAGATNQLESRVTRAIYGFG